MYTHMADLDTISIAFDTTSVGENIIFRPSITWKKDAGKKEENRENENEPSIKDQLKNKKVKCRICGL